MDLAGLLYREPAFLTVDIGRVLADAQRLLPDKDARALLLADPGSLLDMQAQNLPSAIDQLDQQGQIDFDGNLIE